MLVYSAHWHFIKLYLTTEWGFLLVFFSLFFLFFYQRVDGSVLVGCVFLSLPKGKNLHEHQFSLDFL